MAGRPCAPPDAPRTMLTESAPTQHAREEALWAARRARRAALNERVRAWAAEDDGDAEAARSARLAAQGRLRQALDAQVAEKARARAEAARVPLARALGGGDAADEAAEAAERKRQAAEDLRTNVELAQLKRQSLAEAQARDAMAEREEQEKGSWWRTSQHGHYL